MTLDINTFPTAQKPGANDRNQAARRHQVWAAWVLAIVLSVPGLANASDSETSAASQADIDQLLVEMQRMREQLSEMQVLKERVRVLEDALDDARGFDDYVRLEPAPVKRDAIAASDAETAVEEDEADGVEISGALRLNAFWSDSNQTVKDTRGDSGLDMFRLGADGEIDDLLLSVEYRFYPFMNVIHHGWIGYEFENEDRIQLGITRVPFGLLPYAAHSFWFGVPYYLGFSDDYDLGVKYMRQNGRLDLQFAFFKNAELAGAGDLDRYSYDVVSVGESRNDETNQFNARAAYTFGLGTGCSHEVGVSGQWGEIYNFDTRRRGDHWAAAGHLDTRCGRWNVQFQAARFDYSTKQPMALGNETMRLGGFGTSYDVATKGTFGIANIAYNVPIDSSKIDQVICYNDYSVFYKDQSGFRKSQLNTTGCLVGKGPVSVYLDLVQANNMVFFGEGSLAGGGESDWQRRFNINIGYYW